MYRSFANEKYFCSSLQLLKSWNEILEFQVSTPSQLTPTLTSKYKKSYLQLRLQHGQIFLRIQLLKIYESDEQFTLSLISNWVNTVRVRKTEKICDPDHSDSQLVSTIYNMYTHTKYYLCAYYTLKCDSLQTYMIKYIYHISSDNLSALHHLCFEMFQYFGDKYSVPN